MRTSWLVLALFWVGTLRGQWTLQESHTTASLRGIHSLGNGVAWASGSGGTVLRTEDGGKDWVKCAVPEGAEKLDFRGVQAFDAKTAIVMSSGTGDASRLYKTIDGCKSWKLLYTNPDPRGFFDAVQFPTSKSGVLLGDPVDGRYVILSTFDGGAHWTRAETPDLASATPSSGAFAASNESLIVPGGGMPSFVTGGPGGAFIYSGNEDCTMGTDYATCVRLSWHFTKTSLPLEGGTNAAGAFALATHHGAGIAVGGDYRKPDQSAGTADFLNPFGGWSPSNSQPHGYRSAVAYFAAKDTWITVGPNGTDISSDDGRNWQPLRPGPNDAADADKHWNALSLPFVVGEHGRIGVLRADAIAKP